MRFKIKLQAGLQTIPINYSHFFASTFYGCLTNPLQTAIFQNAVVFKSKIYFGRHSETIGEESRFLLSP